jgi:protoporphyrinogen/coproporphyrinogen III oxidase
VTARSVLLCVPAPVAAALHANPSGDERDFLAACTFSAMVKVGCLLSRPLTPAAPRPVYALLVPRAADPALAGLILDHVKHPGRAPAGRGLVSLIAAPGRVPDLLDAPDDAVADTLCGTAEHYAPGLRAATTATVVTRFRHALPEATPAALALRARFAARPLAPVEYAGDWTLLRPSSEGAIRSAATAASRVLARLGSTVDIREAV